MGHDGERECYEELSNKSVKPDTPWPRKGDVQRTVEQYMTQPPGFCMLPTSPPGNFPEVDVELIRAAVQVVNNVDIDELNGLGKAAHDYLLRKFNADKPMTEDQLKKLEKLADSLPRGL